MVPKPGFPKVLETWFLAIRLSGSRLTAKIAENAESLKTSALRSQPLVIGGTDTTIGAS